MEKNGAIGPMTPVQSGCCGGRCKSAAEQSYPTTEEEANQIEGVDLAKELIDAIYSKEEGSCNQSKADNG